MKGQTNAIIKNENNVKSVATIFNTSTSNVTASSGNTTQIATTTFEKANENTSVLIHIYGELHASAGQAALEVSFNGETYQAITNGTGNPEGVFRTVIVDNVPAGTYTFALSISGIGGTATADSYCSRGCFLLEI